MIVPSSQITVKKKIGKANGKDITYVKTVGGYHMVVDHEGSVLGAGPHKMVARHIASKYQKGIEWTELSKSDHLPLEAYEHLLPQYEEMTAALREAQNG